MRTCPVLEGFGTCLDFFLVVSMANFKVDLSYEKREDWWRVWVKSRTVLPSNVLCLWHSSVPTALESQ